MTAELREWAANSESWQQLKRISAASDAVTEAFEALIDQIVAESSPQVEVAYGEYRQAKARLAEAYEEEQ